MVMCKQNKIKGHSATAFGNDTEGMKFAIFSDFDDCAKSLQDGCSKRITHLIAVRPLHIPNCIAYSSKGILAAKALLLGLEYRL